MLSIGELTGKFKRELIFQERIAVADLFVKGVAVG